MAERFDPTAILRTPGRRNCRPLLNKQVKIRACCSVKRRYGGILRTMRVHVSTKISGSTPLLERVLPTLLKVSAVLSISDTPSGCLFFHRAGLDLRHFAALAAFAAAPRSAKAVVALL